MPIFFTPNLDFWEYVGVLGAVIYAARYLLVAYDRLPSQCPAHYWSSLVAALLVMVSLYQSFNLPAALTQVFFVIVSIIGIARHSGSARRRHRNERFRKAITPHKRYAT